MDESKKHRAILLVQMEVHELESNGQCSGHIVNNTKLAEYGLKSKFTIKIDGNNLDECLRKLKEKFNS